MPDYRVYGSDGKGNIKELPPEEFAKAFGISEFDANLLIKGMNITKTICVVSGQKENPPLVWNENMPSSLTEFVTDHVATKLKSNPGWSIKDFDWGLLYEDDGKTLRYKQ